MVEGIDWLLKHLSKREKLVPFIFHNRQANVGNSKFICFAYFITHQALPKHPCLEMFYKVLAIHFERNVETFISTMISNDDI